MKTKVILMYNHKGGTSKTTTLVNLAQELGARYGKKVLAIDNDPQNSLSYLCNLDINEHSANESLDGEPHEPYTDENGVRHPAFIPDIGYMQSLFMYEGIMPEKEDLDSAIVRPKYLTREMEEGKFGWQVKEKEFAFDLLPSYNKGLSMVELLYLSASEEPFILRQSNRKYARYTLKYVVERIKEFYDYDYILIDSLPSLGILAINGLAASDSLIICATPDVLSITGLNKVLSNLRELNQFIPNFHILGIMFSMYAGTKADDEMIRETKELAESAGINVFETRLPRINRMRAMSADEGSAVTSNTRDFRKYRDAIDRLIEEIFRIEEMNEENDKKKEGRND